MGRKWNELIRQDVVELNFLYDMIRYKIYCGVKVIY